MQPSNTTRTPRPSQVATSRTILFHPLGEGGHVGPTLVLARKLRERGDRVVYLTEVAMRTRITGEGFEFVPYLETKYPEDRVFGGSLEDFVTKDGDMWDELVSGRLQEQIASIAPDLILYDVCRFETGLESHRMRIPCVRISTSFPTLMDPQVPGLFSDLLPGESTAIERMREWHCLTASFSKPPRIADRLHMSLVFQNVVKSCHLELEQIGLGAMGYAIEGELEMVMSSKSLEFPEASMPEERVYAGPCLAPFQDEPFSWDGRRRGAPLVYCAFGGQSSNYPRLPAFVESLLAICVQRPDIDFVLAGAQEMVQSYSLPENMCFLTWAPQRTLLSEADVFITHGGQSSIREAIWHGAPMLVYPQAYDQHGNAARVVRHDLGERILEDKPSPQALENAIERLLTDSRFTDSVRKTQEALRQEANSSNALGFVDCVLRKGVQPVSSESVRQRTERIIVASLGYLPA